ncbi:unnamed protein product [Cylicocyclus nassatus]|uniref:Uncharacterized protein n=1 Tax=Cylicocyclus nassatus TaxID=53992 RepID=A0AA36DLI7_CYLNA|nr:unnamed protein product [Cylicocyclus nassatus]
MSSLRSTLVSALVVLCLASFGAEAFLGGCGYGGFGFEYNIYGGYGGFGCGLGGIGAYGGSFGASGGYHGELIILLTHIEIAVSVKCYVYSPDQGARRKVPSNAAHCTFTMSSRCMQGQYSEGIPWDMSLVKDGCYIMKSTNMFACTCSSKDFCSSDHKFIRNLWKKSSSYDKGSLFTNCLNTLVADEATSDVDKSESMRLSDEDEGWSFDEFSFKSFKNSTLVKMHNYFFVLIAVLFAL